MPSLISFITQRQGYTHHLVLNSLRQYQDVDLQQENRVTQHDQASVRLLILTHVNLSTTLFSTFKKSKKTNNEKKRVERREENIKMGRIVKE